MNDVCLSGRLTKDPINTQTQTTQIASFTLAVNREFSKEKTADFIPCVAFNQAAKYIIQYIKKGDLIEMNGRIQVRSYQGKNGETNYVTEVIVDRVGLLSKVQSQSQSQEEPTETKSSNTIIHRHITEEKVTIPDDDLPF